ncbi:MULTISPECIES: Fe-S cluster assembly sulfur transfer protein SufU [unclassified Agromyces]|uniref:Fe-S cluster assembly sulfur transfer protein SufU n=1 Tax=unclassified Agromyces TaxID=2639701 RepID=UPI003014C01B
MAGLEGLYQQIILDHSRERHGDGPLAGADGEHHEFNPTCGDEITLRVKLDPGHERIEQVAWEGDGCSISMASASVLTDLVQGRPVGEALATAETFREMLRSKGEGEPDEDVLGDAIAFHGVARYVMRIKCAMLGWVALEAAVAKAR